MIEIRMTNDEKALSLRFVSSSEFLRPYFPCRYSRKRNAAEAPQVLADFRHAIHVGRIEFHGQLMAAGDLDRRVLAGPRSR